MLAPTALKKLLVLPVFHAPLLLARTTAAMASSGVVLMAAPAPASKLVPLERLTADPDTSRVGVPRNPSNSSYSMMAWPGAADADVPTQVQVAEVSVPTAMA